MRMVERTLTPVRMMAKCRKWTSFSTEGRRSGSLLPQKGAGKTKSITIRERPTARLIIRPQKAPWKKRWVISRLNVTRNKRQMKWNSPTVLRWKLGEKSFSGHSDLIYRSVCWYLSLQAEWPSDHPCPCVYSSNRFSARTRVRPFITQKFIQPYPILSILPSIYLLIKSTHPSKSTIQSIQAVRSILFVIWNQYIHPLSHPSINPILSIFQVPIQNKHHIPPI